MNGYQSKNKDTSCSVLFFGDMKKGTIETMISDTDMYRYDKSGQNMVG